MIWVINKERRIREFIADILDNDKELKDASKTFSDYLSSADMERIKDGDSIYGSLFMSELFLIKANYTYINIIPPKNERKEWVGWRYNIRRDLEEGQAAIILMDKDEYTIKK